MPRDGAMIFSDLIGKLDTPRVECPKCGPAGRYRLADLLMRYGRAFTVDVTAIAPASRRAATTIRAARFVRTSRASGEQNL